MKILFVIPVVSTTMVKPRLPSVGIAYLSATLKQQGHKVKVWDCAVELKDDPAFDDVLKWADVICVSLYSLNVGESYLFVDKIRQKVSGKKIVVGGPHVTATGKKILAQCCACYAVSGEGEQTLVELLNFIRDGGNPRNIDGLIWRLDGFIIQNKPREFIKDISLLPFPDYSVFKMRRYANHSLNEMPIVTSRGCPFDCIFCSVKLVAGQRFRPRTPEDVVLEMSHRYDRGTRNFYVCDDIFNLDTERAERICDLIIGNKMRVGLVFQNGIRADLVTPRLLAKMKQAGCKMVVFSAESGNDEVLTTIRKKLSVEKIRRAVDLADLAGIKFIVNFIVGHPTETYEKGMDSIRLAQEISEKKNCITVMFFNLVPYPGTVAKEWVDTNAKWLYSERDYLNRSMLSNAPLFETYDYTRRERTKLLRMGDKIHRKSLLRFIFGKRLGWLAWIITSIPFLKEILSRFAFDKRGGSKIIYERFLNKLYEDVP